MLALSGREKQRVVTGLGVLVKVLLNGGQEVRRNRHVADSGIGLGCSDEELTVHSDDGPADLDDALGEVDVLAS